MVDTVSEFQQVFLTYKDVAEANPEWSDRMVEDYLSTKRDITKATETADKAVDTSSASVLIPALIKRMDALEKKHDINYGQIGLVDRVNALEKTNPTKYGQIALDQIDKLSLKSVNITASFTTRGNQFVTCNNTVGILLTLNPYPKDLERITIKRNAIGSVKFVGNIDGNTNEYIASVGDGIDLVYTNAMGYWGAV